MAQSPKQIILIAAKCVACDPRGRGRKVGTAYGKIFDLYHWKRHPLCPNCEGPLTKLFETRVPIEYLRSE